MKKAVMWCLTVLAIAISNLVVAEDIPIAKLRQTAPETVSFVIEGEQVTVPLILPDTDMLPIVLCDLAVCDSESLNINYPDARKTKASSDSATLYLEKGMDTLAVKGKKPLKHFLLRDGVANNCEMTPEQARQHLERILDTAGYELDIRVQNTWLAFESAYYCEGQSIEYKGRGWRVNVPDIEQPVNANGYYYFFPVQYVNNVPIFGQYNRAYVPAVEGDGMIDSSHNWFQIHNEDSYIVSMGFYEPVMVIEEDVLLAPIDTVIEQIQKRIDEGMLVSVDAVELGYSLCLAKRDGQVVMSESRDGDMMRVIVPHWRVYGYDHKDDLNNLQYIDNGPNTEERWNSRHVFESRFDVRTGYPAQQGFVNID